MSARRARVIVATAIILSAIALADGAWAWFSSGGQGASSAATSGMQPVTVAALTGGDEPSTELIPGGTADVLLRVLNPNPYAVTLVSAVGNGTVTGSGGLGVCTTTGVTFTDQTGLSDVIAASGTTLVDLPGAASMSSTSSSGCQGAAFAIPVSITVEET